MASIVLRPEVPTASLSELSLVAGRAVARALGEIADLAAEVKWPNDVLVNGRKVAGILAEAREGRVVLGIGVNVSQATDELPLRPEYPATSLLLETGAGCRGLRSSRPCSTTSSASTTPGWPPTADGTSSGSPRRPTP